MSWHGAAKSELTKKGVSDEERAGLFDPSFMANLTPALPYLEKKGIKMAVNAGASDTEKLAKVVIKAIEDAGLNLKVAWIEGDDVMEAVNKLLAKGEKFENICFGGDFKDWGFEPLAAQCYLGGAGICEGFRQGADIIICGRVADVRIARDGDLLDFGHLLISSSGCSNGWRFDVVAWLGPRKGL